MKKTAVLVVLVGLLGGALASFMPVDVANRIGRLSQQSCLPTSMASRTVSVNDNSKCATVCIDDTQCLSYTTVNTTKTCYLFYFGADTRFTSLDKTTPGLTCVDYTYPQRASSSHTLNSCSNHQCQNGALCILDSSNSVGYRCQCVQYHGRSFRSQYCDTTQTDQLTVFKTINPLLTQLLDAKYFQLGARQFAVVAPIASQTAVAIYELTANNQFQLYTSIYESYNDYKGLLQLVPGNNQVHMVVAKRSYTYEAGYTKGYTFNPNDIVITAISSASPSSLPSDGSGSVAPVTVSGVPLYQAISTGISVVVVQPQTGTVESTNLFDTSASSTAFVTFINGISTNRIVVLAAVGAVFGGWDATCVSTINAIGANLTLPLNSSLLFTLVGFKKPYANYDPVQAVQQTAAPSAGSITLVKTVGGGVTYVNQMTDFVNGYMNDVRLFSDGQVWYAAVYSSGVYLYRMIGGMLSYSTVISSPSGASFSGGVALQEAYGEKVLIVANSNQYGSICLYQLNGTTWSPQGTCSTGNTQYANAIDTFELNNIPYVIITENDPSTTGAFMYIYRWHKVNGVLILNQISKTNVSQVSIGLAVNVFSQNAYILITPYGLRPHQLYKLSVGTSGVERLSLINPSQTQTYNNMMRGEVFVRNNQVNVLVGGYYYPNGTNALEATWYTLN